MNDFAAATILITGAASGIGAVSARLLAQRGAARLILADIDGDALSALACSIDCETNLIAGDVTNEQLWAEAELAGITHALVNAGIAAAGPIEECSFAEWRRVLSVNLDGAFLTLQAAMRAIRRGGSGGSIVVTASATGIKAEPGIAAYAASKAGAIQLARVAAKEGAPDRIRVNSIAPGGVETPIWSRMPFFQDLAEKCGSEAAAFEAMGAAATPLGRYAKPEEIAEQIAFLLSGRAAFITGACLVSDGGYSL